MHHSTVGITTVPTSFSPDPEADFDITAKQFQTARRAPQGTWLHNGFAVSYPFPIIVLFVYLLHPCEINQCLTRGNPQTPHFLPAFNAAVRSFPLDKGAAGKARWP